MNVAPQSTMKDNNEGARPLMFRDVSLPLLVLVVAVLASTLIAIIERILGSVKRKPP